MALHVLPSIVGHQALEHDHHGWYRKHRSWIISTRGLKVGMLQIEGRRERWEGRDGGGKGDHVYGAEWVFYANLHIAKEPFKRA